jgi:zinc protease
MVKLLQRAGLAFGPDTNAFTSFRQTVYMLDLPKNDAATIDTGLKIFGETVNKLSFVPAAIDRERGVILSEERRGDSPEFRLYKQNLAFLLKGQKIPERLPIGDPVLLRKMSREDFVAFYRAYYRPENALLVAVGDFDVAAMETKVRSAFSAWTQPGAAGPQPDFGKPASRGLEADLRVEGGLPASVSMNWTSPPDLRKDTIAKRREDLRLTLAYAVVNRRLERIARAASPPFISANITRHVYERSATMVEMEASVRPGRWKEALGAMEQELRKALKFGVSQGELDREIAEYRAAFQQAAAGAATRDTRALANAVVDSFDDEEVFTAPADDLKLFEDAMKGFTAAEASAALQASVPKAGGPLLFLSSPQAVDGGKAALVDAYKKSAATEVKAPSYTSDKAFSYQDFGAPGTVATRKRDADLDLDLVKFQNGVRLTMKKTPFEEKNMYVTVRLPGGLSTMPPQHGLSLLAPFVLSEGGLGKLSQDEIEETTAGKLVGVRYVVGNGALGLGGRTRAEDLLLQLQLMTASITDPGFRPDGLTRIQAAAENFVRQYGTEPDRVLARDSDAILRSNDGRWVFPSLEEVRALKIEQFKQAFGEAFASRPIEVSVVGDFDPDAVIAAVGKTLGALPARPATSKPLQKIAFPSKAETLNLTHEGRADQSAAFVAWPAVDFSDRRKAQAARAARLILQNRLVEEYREKRGATYSPQTDEEYSLIFPGYGYVAALVETPTGQAATFYQVVDELTAELRDGKFDDDAVTRALRPEIETLRNAARRNGFWVAVLQDFQSNPRRKELIRTRITDLETMTRAEIIAAAKATFVSGKAVRIVVTPKTQGTK